MKRPERPLPDLTPRPWARLLDYFYGPGELEAIMLNAALAAEAEERGQTPPPPVTAEDVIREGIAKAIVDRVLK